VIACACTTGTFLALRVTSFPVKTPEKRAGTQLPVAHVCTRGNPLRGHVTSGSSIAHAQWHILYYYYSSSTKCTGCACACDHFREIMIDLFSGVLYPVVDGVFILKTRTTSTICIIYYLMSFIIVE
jgi:hypothetical protein